MNPKPIISVVLPVYNGMPLLKESVFSVLEQEGVEFELIIGDDTSADGSREYLKSINNPVIRLICHPANKGLFGNLNALIKEARGKIIHLWSQDDIMLPYCLKNTVDFHKKNPHIGFAFCKYLLVNAAGEVIGENAVTHHQFMSVEGHAITSLITGSAPGNIANVSIRKSNIEEVGFFNEHMKYSGDFDMWCGLTKEKPVGIIQEQLIKLRSHSGQLSRKPEMWIYRLTENHSIYRRFLERISPQKIEHVKRGMRWRIYTQYFGLLLKLVRIGRFDLFKSYLLELNRQSSIAGNIWRYLILLVARKVGLRAALQNRIYYEKISQS